MGIISNLFRGKASSKLEQMVEELKPHFQTPEGRIQVVKSILSSEFPLLITEYTFVVGGDSRYVMFIPEDRRKFLLQGFEEGLLKEDYETFGQYKDSAVLEAYPDKGTIFHVHPRESIEGYFAKGSHFSGVDQIFSKNQPLGLVEYGVIDLEGGAINLLSRLSICYLKKEREVLELQIRLNSDGTYSSTDGIIEHSGKVPIVSSATPEFVDNLRTLDFRDELITYLCNFCIGKTKTI